jgi:iduronate 2-sulfatase
MNPHPSRPVPRRFRFPSILAMLVGLALLSGVPAAAAAKPNVILIMMDDLRPELGCYGVEGLITPNIDRLAEKGVLFRNAYVQYPVCNPSRASMLSGLRPDETGIVTNDLPFRKAMPHVQSLPQVFRNHGYFTAGIGKIFHLAEDRKDGKGRPLKFADELSWEFFHDGMDDATRLGKTGEGRNLTQGRLGWCQWLAAEGDDEDQPDGLNAKVAVELLEKHHDKPFFLGIGMHKPHDPFIAPKKYFDLYPLEATKLAEEPAERSGQVRHAVPNRRDFAEFTDKERREFKRAYQACTTFADAQLGKVFDAMDRLKLWDNTIVVLIGDHGYHLGEHEWWNKVTVYEIGGRAPLLVLVPGVQGLGKSTEALVEFVDFYPTLLDYAGLPVPHQLAGTSFRSIMEDPGLPGKQAAYTQVNRGKTIGRSVRTKRWRYTEWGPGGKDGIELYDHQKDSGEYHNLATATQHAATRGELAELLRQGFPEPERAVR